jgi:hypothetical protein
VLIGVPRRGLIVGGCTGSHVSRRAFLAAFGTAGLPIVLVVDPQLAFYLFV